VGAVQPADGRAVFFVVEADREQLTQLATRVRTGRLTPLVNTVRPLDETPAAFTAGGRTIIKVVG